MASIVTRLPWSAHRRLGASVLIGLAVGLAASTIDTSIGVLAGLAAVSLVFNLWTLRALWPMDAETTRAHAVREDLNPFVEEVLLAGVALGTIAGIALLILNADQRSATTVAALGLLSVFLAWGTLHTSYVGHYARAYFATDPPGGIDFHQQDGPRFVDFYYFSFNLGMTYQVSDNDLSSTRLRSLVLRHCLLSYFFGTVILAATINLVAGIATNS